MLISIVTPSLNRCRMIRAAIASLRAQGDPDIEHIVVDGGSTDGTLAMLAADYPDIKLIVERDENLYDAINKGLRAARGDIIGLLNSDDQLLPGALAAVRAGFAAHPHADTVGGGCLVRPVSADGVGQALAVYNHPAMKALRPGDVISGLILTNGRFFRRDVFLRLGGFDIAYPVLADREFYARWLLAKVKTAVIPDLIYGYGLHDGSLTFNNRINPRHLAEATGLCRRHLSAATAPLAQRFYRRWHGWAAGYEILYALRQKRLRAALALARAAFGTDPLWPVQFLAHLAWHLWTRSERRG